MEPVLIQNNKKQPASGLEADQQEANAKTLAELRLKENSGNNYLYMVRVEDPSSKSTFRSFLALKIREDAHAIDIVGIEISASKENTFQTYSDVTKYVQEGKSVKIINIRFPWTRVISIENKTYKRK